MQLVDFLKLLSPLDVVVLTLEEQVIIKSFEVDECVPASFLLEKAEKFIHLGEFPTRNITYWNTTEGKTKEEVSDWDEKLIKELSHSRMEWELQELDNTKKVMKVSCEIYMIAHNCSSLSRELLKEVKCARVHTAFGQFEVEI